MTQIRVVAVQPQSFRRLEERKNLDRIAIYLDEAARAGARIVCFPEGYPGPYFDRLDWSPYETVAEKAREHGFYVLYGTVDPAEEDVGAYHVTQKLVGPEGSLLGSYHRLQPTPEGVNRVLTGEKKIAPGDHLLVQEVDGVKIGILICSEIFNPELARLYALEGVHILFAPIGAMVYELRDTWRTVLWARAIENLCYVAACQNLYGMEDGLALIAGPEVILAERKDPGILVADCDIDRIEWLRGQLESLDLPKPYKVVPGLLEYRRPELYEKLADQNVNHFDFFSFRDQ